MIPVRTGKAIGLVNIKLRKEIIITKIQRYFENELEQDIGQFDAEFLLDFFSKEIGILYYNRALQDAQTVLLTKIDSITEAITEIEK